MSSSNIRVFVKWKNSTVFAGEDIECTITFKNVAPTEASTRTPVPSQSGFATGGERQRKLPAAVYNSSKPSISRNSSFVSQILTPTLRDAFNTPSLRSPSIAGDRRPISPQSVTSGNNAGEQKHGRSLSIISIGTNAGTEASHERGVQIRRPARGHGRSASLQVVRPSSYPRTSSPIHVFLLLTSCSDFTRPSLRNSPFSPFACSVLANFRPGHSNRSQLFYPPWKKETRSCDFSQYSCST